VHHKKLPARIVFGPSRPPQWGFMAAAIYHAKAAPDQVAVTIRDFMSRRPAALWPGQYQVLARSYKCAGGQLFVGALQF
jgi:hypothetical protein